MMLFYKPYCYVKRPKFNGPMDKMYRNFWYQANLIISILGHSDFVSSNVLLNYFLRIMTPSKCSFILYCDLHLKIWDRREVVVAQLVERWLPIPEVRGSIPVTCKKILTLNICILSTVFWKDKNKEKRGWEWPLFKKKTETESLQMLRRLL